MPVVGLGHTGLWVHDLERMRDFYERVIGLTVTDADDEQGIVFFSANPDEEHHEFVLQRGRTAPPGTMLTHQISWRVDSVETLQMYHHRFKAEGVPVQQEVTHGNAYGIYFFDPEGNRGEVYLRIDKDVRQPFRKSLNLEQSVEDVNAEAERLLTDGGPAYRPVTWTPVPDSAKEQAQGPGRAR
jgi:catechol-2,3-dioxygenase